MEPSPFDSPLSLTRLSCPLSLSLSLFSDGGTLRRLPTQMDELYLSAPKNSEGSDRVFITPHIDGFLGWLPFFTAYRCVYGLTGPHETVTIQPMRDPAEQEVNVGPGDFTCFDYNREIHWIEHRAQANATLDDRMVLKLHFYEVGHSSHAVTHSLARIVGHSNRRSRSQSLGHCTNTPATSPANPTK